MAGCAGSSTSLSRRVWSRISRTVSRSSSTSGSTAFWRVARPNSSRTSRGRFPPRSSPSFSAFRRRTGIVSASGLRGIVSSDQSRFAALRALPAIWSFVRYLRNLVDTRRRSPTEDLVGRLVAAESEGDRLSADELLAMVFLLIVAGHETTTNLIANGTLALLQNPGELERLMLDPTLTESAVEELLRYAGPLVTSTERYAREETEIAGVRIPAGGLVFAVLAAANRDEEVFSAPETLDLGRSPNRHLGFGYGLHYCLGAPLARLEAKIALRALVDRLPGLRLSIPADRLRWRPGLVVRGLEALPLTLGRTQGSRSASTTTQEGTNR